MVSAPDLTRKRPRRARVLSVDGSGYAVLGIYVRGMWRRVGGQCRTELREGEWIEILLEEKEDQVLFRVVNRA